MSSSINEGVPLSPEETSSSHAFLLALSALATKAFELEGFLPLPRPRPPPPPPSPEVPTSSFLALPLDFFDAASEPTLPGGVIHGTAPAGTGQRPYSTPISAKHLFKQRFLLQTSAKERYSFLFQGPKMSEASRSNSATITSSLEPLGLRSPKTREVKSYAIPAKHFARTLEEPNQRTKAKSPRSKTLPP